MNALNEGHGYRRKENRDIYQQAVVLFFEEHLTGGTLTGGTLPGGTPTGAR
jgi:hypothetical protein